MAALPTADEKARMALLVFQHFNVRPDEVLTQGNFVAYAAKNDVRTEDLAEGIDRGYELGWFDGGPNGTIILTKAGFEAI